MSLFSPSAVYVDSLMTCLVSRQWRWPQACHLFVDTGTDLEVLHDFARSIGMKRAWFQWTSMPHYDLNAARRAVALKHGAVELGRRETVDIIRRWRTSAASPAAGREQTGEEA